MKENKYTISEAARLLSVENHVLRYWEEELELKIPRNELGHRYYREEEIQLLHCIKELKNKGFQLKAVKEVLPDLEQKKLIDIHKLLITQEELENQELEQLEQARQKEMTQGEEVQRQDIQKENRRKETEEREKKKREKREDPRSTREKTFSQKGDSDCRCMYFTGSGDIAFKQLFDGVYDKTQRQKSILCRRLSDLLPELFRKRT